MLGAHSACGVCKGAGFEGGRMRCKFCGADMRAVTYNSDGYSERLVVLDDFNKINEDSPTSTGGGRNRQKQA